MLGLEPSPLREDREPALGVAKPGGGGAGAFFFLDSDWTRASQGGSLGLGVPPDRLDEETQRQEWRRHGSTQTNKSRDNKQRHYEKTLSGRRR